MEYKELPNKFRAHRNDKKKSEIQGYSIMKPEGTCDIVDNHPRLVMVHRPRGYNKGGFSKICPTLSDQNFHQNHFVLVSPKSTSMPSKSTKNTSQNIRSMEMSQISNGQMSRILKYFVEGFLANPFLLPESEVASQIPEAHSFLKSLGLHRKNSHAFYFLKTLRGFYLTTKAEPSELSSIRWMNLGMTSNGKCLTVKTSVSPRTGNECSLSDILEEQVASKYFLSGKAVKAILNTVGELFQPEKNG